MAPVSLNTRIAQCTRCPRLIEYCAEVARTKRRAYRDEEYWGRPVPSFGVAQPRLLVVGLAPGAHGANRTGRMFTGDSSGDWLYRALFAHGFANQAESAHRRDGLKLEDTRITAAAHCAPPGNKPSRAELDACRSYLVEEVAGLRRLRVVLALGRIAFDAVRKAWRELDRPAFAPEPAFAHGAEAVSSDVTLLCSYHPSRQNTQTGRLTRAMWHAVFRRTRGILDA